MVVQRTDEIEGLLAEIARLQALLDAHGIQWQRSPLPERSASSFSRNMLRKADMQRKVINIIEHSVQ